MGSPLESYATDNCPSELTNHSLLLTKHESSRCKGVLGHHFAILFMFVVADSHWTFFHSTKSACHVEQRSPSAQTHCGLWSVSFGMKTFAVFCVSTLSTNLVVETMTSAQPGLHKNAFLVEITSNALALKNIVAKSLLSR